MSELVALAAITLDPELQPRADIDQAVLENYVQLLVDGATFPPVTLFRTIGALLLVDGFHRWHAHAVLEMESITADVVQGTRRDALLYSLSANAVHGLQRKPMDYKRAYEIACRNDLVDPSDPEAVAAMLRCSGRTGERLTAAARIAVKDARDTVIVAAKGEGKTVRQIAEETGVSPRTVMYVQKATMAEIAQDPDPPPEILSETAKRNLSDLQTPRALAWSSALRALRGINEQASVNDLFADRYTRFDHVFGPELDAAFTWIDELHRRFVGARNQRRRA